MTLSLNLFVDAHFLIQLDRLRKNIHSDMD